MHDISKHRAPDSPRDPHRAGAKQPERFDPHRADRLDDASRLDYLPPEKIFRWLDPPQDALVVDFGAGTGTFAILLARSRPDVSVIALDEQPEMLERLQAKPEVQHLQNLRPELPEVLASLRGRADRVLAMNVLHELGDEALEALGALLKPDGSALFIDWNAEVDRPVGPPRDHVYGPREGSERLVGFGFSVEPLEPLPYHYVLRARIATPR